MNLSCLGAIKKKARREQTELKPLLAGLKLLFSNIYIPWAHDTSDIMHGKFIFFRGGK